MLTSDQCTNKITDVIATLTSRMEIDRFVKQTAKPDSFMKNTLKTPQW